MATNPDDLQRQQEADRHKREAEAAAIALLLIGRKRYDLPALIRANKVRPRPFRRISPSGIQAGDLAGPHLSVARAWATERAALLAAYTAALQTGSTATLLRQVEDSAGRVAQAVAAAQARFPRLIASLERWHRTQWVSRVKAATGLDVAMLTLPADVSGEVGNAVAWNGQLAEDVHLQARQRITSALLGLVAVAAPVADASAKIGDAVAKAKARARNIGVDQAEKVSARMTSARRVAAGVSTWRWRHFDPQPHPRPEHKARDGRLYTDNTAPTDLPGVLPFCKCWEETVL